MKKFKILSRKLVLNEKYCPIEKHIVEFADGTKGEWLIKVSPDTVAVVPVLTDGSVLLQRTYKHGAGEFMTEFCAGVIDEGETPEQAAQRELAEETGYTAQKFLSLGQAFIDATGCQARQHFFVALDCELVGEQQLDQPEQIEPFTVPDIAAARQLLLTPETMVANSTLTALMFTEAFLKKA